MSEKDKTKNELKEVLDSSLTIIDEVLKDSQSDLTLKEVGTVLSVSKGIATIKGLPHVCTDELLLFPGNTLGIVFNLDKDQVDIVLLDKGDSTVSLDADGSEFKTSSGENCVVSGFSTTECSKGSLAEDPNLELNHRIKLIPMVELEDGEKQPCTGETAKEREKYFK